MSWCNLVVIGAQSETMQPDGHVPAFAPKMEWVIDLIAQASTDDRFKLKQAIESANPFLP